MRTVIFKCYSEKSDRIHVSMIMSLKFLNPVKYLSSCEVLTEIQELCLLGYKNYVPLVPQH